MMEAISAHSQQTALKRIHIHHSYELKYKTQEKIVQGVREVVPDAEVSFLHVNKHSPIRLFDTQNERLTVERGTFVSNAGSQSFFITPTGESSLTSKVSGTPRVLETSVRYFGNNPPVDYSFYGQHILSLSRLNWASSRNFSSEPITLLFSAKIARFMNIFIRNKGEFSLHPDLEKTPWFL